MRGFRNKYVIAFIILFFLGITAGLFFLGNQIIRSSNNTISNEGVAVDLKRIEIELQQSIADYDRDNISDVHVLLNGADDNIDSANIFLIVGDKSILDLKIEEIKTIIGEKTGLDADKIHINFGN